jgi:hypothetical protein
MIIKPLKLESTQEYFRNGILKDLNYNKEEYIVPLCGFCLENEVEEGCICDDCHKNLMGYNKEPR